MSFFMSPRMRYVYWSLLLVIGALLIGGAVVDFILQGDWLTALGLAAMNVAIIYVILHLVGRIRDVSHGA